MKKRRMTLFFSVAALLAASVVGQRESDYADEMMETAATRASGQNSLFGYNEPERIVPQNKLDDSNPFSMSSMYGRSRPFVHAKGISPYVSASSAPGIPSEFPNYVSQGSPMMRPPPQQQRMRQPVPMMMMMPGGAAMMQQAPAMMMAGGAIGRAGPGMLVPVSFMPPQQAAPVSAAFRFASVGGGVGQMQMQQQQATMLVPASMQAPAVAPAELHVNDHLNDPFESNAMHRPWVERKQYRNSADMLAANSQRGQLQLVLAAKADGVPIKKWLTNPHGAHGPMPWAPGNSVNSVDTSTDTAAVPNLQGGGGGRGGRGVVAPLNFRFYEKKQTLSGFSPSGFSAQMVHPGWQPGTPPPPAASSFIELAARRRLVRRTTGRHGRRLLRSGATHGSSATGRRRGGGRGGGSGSGILDSADEPKGTNPFLTFASKLKSHDIEIRGGQVMPVPGGAAKAAAAAEAKDKAKEQKDKAQTPQAVAIDTFRQSVHPEQQTSNAYLTGEAANSPLMSGVGGSLPGAGPDSAPPTGADR
eukprot:g1298.t1